MRKDVVTGCKWTDLLIHPSISQIIHASFCLVFVVSFNCLVCLPTWILIYCFTCIGILCTVVHIFHINLTLLASLPSIFPQTYGYPYLVSSAGRLLTLIRPSLMAMRHDRISPVNGNIVIVFIVSPYSQYSYMNELF